MFLAKFMYEIKFKFAFSYKVITMDTQVSSALNTDVLYMFYKKF